MPDQRLTAVTAAEGPFEAVLFAKRRNNRLRALARISDARNAAWPKQSHHFARLAQMDGRTVAVPCEPDRSNRSDGVVIQDRRDGDAGTEPNIVQQSDAVVNTGHTGRPRVWRFQP